jgi:hypothetical protein
MMHSPRNLFGLLVLVGMVLLPLPASAAGAKVGVIDTIRASLTLKLNARQAVAAALDEIGVAMVPMEDMTSEDGACAESGCYIVIAKRVGATHLVLVSGVANPAGYRLSLDVRDGRTGRSLGTDGKDCELCAEDQFATTLQERVTKLWKRVVREEERAEAASGTRRLQPVVAEPEDKRAEGQGSSRWTQRTPLMGLGLGAVGLVGIGFGAYYLAVDGNAVETSHPTALPGEPAPASHPIILRDTGKWGWTFLGMGSVLLATGAAMMIWGGDDGGGAARDQSDLQVFVGPGSLGLQGKF